MPPKKSQKKTTSKKKPTERRNTKLTRGIDDDDCAVLCSLWEEVLFRPMPVNPLNLYEEHKYITEKLTLATKSLPKFTRHNRYDKLNEFMEWVEKMEIKHSGIEIGYENGLSLKASKELSPNVVVVEVPFSCILTTDVGKQLTTLGPILMEDTIAKSMENVALALTVAHEVLRGNASPWKPYLDILPERPTTPLFYSTEELLNLKPSPIFDETLLLYRAAARQYVYFYMQIYTAANKHVRDRRGSKHVSRMAEFSKDMWHRFENTPFTPENFTFDFYLWCVGIVSSRINLIPVVNTDGSLMHDQRLCSALVPFIDFSNHDSAKSGGGAIYCEESHENVKIALAKIVPEGGEIRIFYGQRYNMLFLLHNGFIPSDNDGDGYCIKIGVPWSKTKGYLTDYINKVGVTEQRHSPKSLLFYFYLPSSSVEIIRDRFENIMLLNESEENLRLHTWQADSIEGLWMLAMAFCSKNENELQNRKQLRARTQKFLYDRFKLLFNDYRNMGAEADAPQSANETLAAYNTRRLKAIECRLLQKYITATEELKNVKPPADSDDGAAAPPSKLKPPSQPKETTDSSKDQTAALATQQANEETDAEPAGSLNKSESLENEMVEKLVLNEDVTGPQVQSAFEDEKLDPNDQK